MEEDGAVSLWIGTAASKPPFQAFLKTFYSDDGDFLGSGFSRAFGIAFYDEGLLEAEYRDMSTRQSGELLEGTSYDDVIIPRFGALGAPDRDANCAVLIYDYRHEGRPEWNGPDLSLGFVGTVAYR
jgi:hypothetical protein